MNYKVLLFLVVLTTSALQAQSAFDTKQKVHAGQESDLQLLPYEARVSTSRTLVNWNEKVDYSALAPLRRDRIRLQIDRNETSGMPARIAGIKLNSAEMATRLAKKTAVKNYLSSFADLLCVEDAEKEFQLIEQNVDDLGFAHFKFQQVYLDFPVYGSEIIGHLNPAGDLIFMGSTQASSFITPVFSVNKEQAIQVAQNELKATGHWHDITEQQKKLLNHETALAKAVILPLENETGAFRLVWHLTIRPNFLERFEYFVDTETGKVLRSYDHTCSIGGETATATDLNGASRLVNTYLYQSNYYMYDSSRDMYTGPVDGLPMQGDGGIETLDFQNSGYNNPQYADITSSNNQWNNPNAISAHYHAGECYEYYKSVHGRNSINGQGGDILSFINVAEDDGSSLENAFWNGQFMYYGNGGQAFSPLAGSLDVSAHEMTHGVIQNTANLEYQGESGAINESMADVFGVLVDWGDWKLGEDVVNTAFFPTGALRDMQNPHNGGNQLGDPGWQPDHYSERYQGSQDNGGVHINSGIVNRAFYLIASNLGKSKSERIYYRALSQYLTKSSKFSDLRLAIVQSAQDISDVTAADITTIENAFATVGIGEAPAGEYQEDLEENEGEEFILFVDENSADPTTMYLTTPAVTGFAPLTEVAPNRKPSVTDDGTTVYFVGTDKNIYALDLTSDPVGQFQLSDDAFWDNCAISKDGSKLAAISVNVDTSIYVFDLLAEDAAKKFTLYNPTFAEGGLNSAGVLYADALEWDYTGENVIYDAFNRLPGFFSEDIEYWDMGVINVWNNSSTNFAEGNIEKIFSSLPDGVSVGNPTFAKVSPYIFAFDYFDFTNNEVAFLGANLETGDVGTIFEQEILAYGTYSVSDAQALFTGRNGETNYVKMASIAANKISASSAPTDLIDAAKWPLWFAQGERVLAGIENTKESQIHLSPVPTIHTLQVDLGTWSIEGFRVIDLIGREIFAVKESQFGTFTIDVGALDSGVYLLELKGKTAIRSQRFIVD